MSINKVMVSKAFTKFRDDLKQVPLSQAGRNILHTKIAALEQLLLDAAIEDENKGGN